MPPCKLAVYGSNYVSYRTMIKQVVAGLSIGNVTQYSPTTSRHQKIACVHSCDLQLDNVPQGTGDLLTLAIERGLAVIDKGSVIKQEAHMTAIGLLDQYGESIPNDLVVLPRYEDLGWEEIEIIESAAWYIANNILMASSEAIDYLSDTDPLDCGIDLSMVEVFRVDNGLHRGNEADGFYNA